jgi:hypothetical protein
LTIEKENGNSNTKKVRYIGLTIIFVATIVAVTILGLRDVNRGTISWE